MNIVFRKETIKASRASKLALERFVLGAQFFVLNAELKAAYQLKMPQFDAVNEMILKAQMECVVPYKKGVDIDKVVAFLKGNKQLEMIGGVSYITKLVASYLKNQGEPENKLWLNTIMTIYPTTQPTFDEDIPF